MGSTKAADEERLASGTPQQDDGTTTDAAAAAAAAADGAGILEKRSDDSNTKREKRGDGSSGGIRNAGPSPGKEGGSLEEEAAVGSIHHILKTAFKELYEEDASDERGEQQQQQQRQHSATLLASPRPGTGDSASGQTTADTTIANAEDGSTLGAVEPGEETSVGLATEITAGSTDPQAETESIETPAEASDAATDEAGGVTAGKEIEAENDEPSGPNEGSLADEAAIQERNGSIEAMLGSQRELAKGLRNYTRGKRQEARESDRAAVDVLKKQGILLGAHIPMGPSGLSLDRSQIESFQGFATSLLDASEVSRANREASLRASGNLPWNRFPKNEDETSVVTRFEPPGYLKKTSIHITREALALKRSTGRRGEQRPIAEQTTVSDGDSDETVTLVDGATGSDGGGGGDGDGDGGGGVGGGATASRSRRALENDTTDDDSDKEEGEDEEEGGGSRKARRVFIKGAQRDADAALMTRMQRKLHFRRNPRWDAESRWHEKLLTAAAPFSESQTRAANSHGGPHAGSNPGSASAGGGTKGKSKTELLMAKPPKGRADGENGYFLATPSIVEYLDYGVDETYRAELVLRNISCLKRGFMLLPPATEYFSIAEVVFPSLEVDPESGATVTGSGDLAPGIAAKVSIDFTPDSLGEYHDKLSVVTEAGTFEVPIHAHRRRPCLSLPESGLLDCGGCLLGEGKTMRFSVRNTGGPVRFRLFPLETLDRRCTSSDGGGGRPNPEDCDGDAAAAAAADSAAGGGGSVFSSSSCSAGDVSLASLATAGGSSGADNKKNQPEGGGHGDWLSSSSRADHAAAATAAVGRVSDGKDSTDDDGVGGGGFERGSINGDLHDDKLEDGRFCVFPRDYCLGEGETVTINAEYLPSATGLHEARFLMLQDNCEERELCVRALCEQVSLRISNIDGIHVPTPAAAAGGERGSPEEPPRVAHPAKISHLLFEPTLLSSTGRRQFTLRNDTSGDLPVNWAISEVPLLLPKEPSRPSAKKRGRGTARHGSTVGARSDATTVSASEFGGTLLAEEEKKRNRNSENSTSNTYNDSNNGEVDREGINCAAEPFMAREVYPTAPLPGQQLAAATAAAAGKREYDIPNEYQLRKIEDEGRNIAGHDGMTSAGLSSSTLISAARDARSVGTMSSSAVTAAARGPFAIVPGFAVVPAHGEVSFEVAFTPTSLGETRFEAVASVMGVPAVSLVYHKPDGILPDDVGGGTEPGVRIGASDSRFRLFLRSLDADGKGVFNRVAIADAVRGLLPLLRDTASTFGNPSPLPTSPTQGGRGGGRGPPTSVGVCHSPFSSPPSSLPLPPPVVLNTDFAVARAAAWHPNQEEAEGGDDASTGGTSLPVPLRAGGSVSGSCNGGIPQEGEGEYIDVSALVEEAAKRLDPDETADGYAEEQTVTFAGVLEVLGPEIRARVTHAFGDKSLEELAVRHRTDMAGLQIEMRAAGEAVRLSLEPAVLQAPGEVPYGIPQTMEFHVCNSSSAATEIEFNLEGLTVLAANDALVHSSVDTVAAAAAAASTPTGKGAEKDDSTTTGSHASVPPARQACDLQIFPSRAVVPPGGIVTCRATLTSYCLGSNVVHVPMIAPTAAPAELGEELGIRICFTGAGGAACIEAAELDLGLIAVGTGMAKTVRLTNVGGVPLSFTMVQSGTDAEALAESLIRDFAWQNPPDSHGDNDHQDSIGDDIFEINSATGGGGGAGAGAEGEAGLQTNNALDAACPLGTGADGNNKALGMRRGSTESIGSADSFSVPRDGCWVGFEPAFGDIAPGRSATITVTCEAGKVPERFRAVARVLLQSSDGRGVSFGSEYVAVRAEVQEPTVYISGVDVDVGTAYIGVPLKRRVSMVNLSNLEARFKWDRPGGASGSFELELVPDCGVLKGREVRDVELRYTARSAGPVEEVYACHIFGMAQPLGFAIKAKNRGPTLSFGLLEDGEKAPRPIQRPSLPQYLGEEPLPDPVPAPSLEFGTVELRGRKKLRVFVRNLSAIATNFTAKVRKHSCTPCPKRLKLANMSYSALQRVVANPRALAAYIDDDDDEDEQQQQQQQQRQHHHQLNVASETAAALATADSTAIGKSTAAANARSGKPTIASAAVGGGGGVGRGVGVVSSSATRAGAGAGVGAARGSAKLSGAEPPMLRSSQCSQGVDSGGRTRPVLGAEHEATEAFFSEGGRARTKALFDQREDCFILKQGLGAAFLVEPVEGHLPPWGVVEVSITVFNDTPGRYSDKFELAFTGAPIAYLPMKVFVEGSPLSLKREALGLDMSGPEPLLGFGEVFVGGGKTFRAIKVKNEGTLPAMLTWSMQDANIDAKEAAKKVDVSLQVVKRTDDVGGWTADFSLSYRPPNSFQSPFMVQPRQAIVDPRSEGAFKVVLPEHTKGEMAARLVADAYWLPPSDGSSSSQNSSGASLASIASSGPALDNRIVKSQSATKSGMPQGDGAASEVGGALSPLTPGSQPPPEGSSSKGNPTNSASAFPVGDARVVSTAGDSSISSSENCMSQYGGMAPGGRMEGVASRGGGGGGLVGGGGKKRKGKSTTLVATMHARSAATSIINKTINRKHGRTTSGAVTLKAMAWGIEPRLALDKKTHDALRSESGGNALLPLAPTCDGGSGLTGTAAAARAQGGVSSGKQAAATQGVGNDSGAPDGVGKQFLKFEAWSTRACAASSPWAAHPTMRRQISLSNPLTVAVSFVVQTRGPFAINPSPTKKRLRSGVGDGSGGGGSKNSTGGKSTMVVAQSASSPCRDSDATLAAHKRTATATAAAVTSGASGAGARAGARAGAGRGPGEGPGVATAPVYTTPQPSRGHKTASTETKTNATEVGAVGAQRQTGALVGGRGAETSQPDQARGGGTEGGRGGGTGRRRGGGRGVASASQQQAVKLLPGQNYQMELVFLPATASEDIEEALQSSFCPGSEDIPRLILRMAGELCITFSTGHAQTICLRGEVLRPIIVVAPPTHSFGTIHTQRRGNATLYVGNPTYADAEWTLSHIPAPPPKHRLFESNRASKAAAAAVASAGAAAAVMAPRKRSFAGQYTCEYIAGKGAAGDRGSSPLELGCTDASSSPMCSRETSGGRRASGAASQGGSGGSRGGRLKLLPPAAPAAPAGEPFAPPPVFVDDPSVFVFNEVVGVARGVKLPLSSSASCLPEDWNRLEEACWPQQPTRVTWGCVVDSNLGGRSREGASVQQRRRNHQSSLPRHAHFREPGQPESSPSVMDVGAAGWAQGGIFWRKEPHGQRQAAGVTLSLERFTVQKEETEKGYRAPRPLEVKFMPKRNVLYRSRFRLNVRGGEGAEIVLEGSGTYQEDSTPGKLPRV